jgi:hypothetical protein
MKLKLKPPGTKRLRLNRDIPLSIYAFEFNLRLYMKAAAEREEAARAAEQALIRYGLTPIACHAV